MLSHRTVLTLATIGLALQDEFDFEASIIGRTVLALIVLGSFVMPTRPVGEVLAIVAQFGRVAVCFVST